MQLIAQALQYSVVAGAGGLRKFSNKNFLLSQIGFKKLNIIQRKVLRMFGCFLATIGLPQRVLVVGVARDCMAL